MKLIIEAEPTRSYADRGEMPRLARVLPLRSPLSIPGLYGAEIGHATAELDNADGLISRHFALPPVRCKARIEDDGGAILLSGTIATIELGALAALTLEAGELAPLTDPLPLRTSVVWGAFSDVRVLPHVYGRVTLRPVQYDREGTLFLLADHPIAGVDRVTRDDAPTQGYALHHTQDSTGKTVAMLELAEPLAPGERLAVTLRGKRAPSGALLDRPATVLEDILALAGVNVPADVLDRLRSEAADIEIGGVLDQPGLSTKAALDAIVQSIGGAWSLGARDGVLLDPFSDDAAPVRATIDPHTCTHPQAKADHDDIVTLLRITYDHNHATGQPRRAVQLIAPEAMLTFGRIEREWQAPWLKSPRQAEILGRKLLTHLARPRWKISFTYTGKTRLQPGDLVHLAHPALPVTGAFRLMSADFDPANLSTACSVLASVGEAPRIELATLSNAHEPVIPPGATVDYANGVATFTIRDDLGNPLPGAEVTLDGHATRLTDGAGRVSFQASRGKHMLLVEAQGYSPMQIEVTV
ncbi:MAG: hypothetical protein AB1332_06815 [Pseudomonadota bacterium]|jgi:hypothetical protein